MADKDNNLEELEAQKTQEELDAAQGKVSLEENDNWTFEAEAPMLNSNIEADSFEIDIPKEEKPISKPKSAPKNKIQSEVAIPAKPKEKVEVTKNDKIMFALTALIIAVVIVLCAFLGVRYYKEIVPNSTNPKYNQAQVQADTVMIIDGVEIPLGYYNYYYTMTFQNYTNGQYDVDVTKDFTKQTTVDADGNEITWAQLFENETIKALKIDITNYNAATKEGIKLTEDQKKNIDSAISTLKEQAKAKVTDDTDKKSEADIFKQYLVDTYGEGVTEEILRTMLERYYVSNQYVQRASVDEKVSDKEYDAYFSEHKDNYKKVTVAYLPIKFEPTDEKAKQESVEKAQKYADQIKSLDDMKLLIPEVWADTIDELIAQGYADNKEEFIVEIAENMQVDITKNMEGFIEEASDWLFDSKTKVGDVSTFADEGVVYIFMKVSDVEYDESELYSVRHILIQPITEDEEKLAAIQSGQQVTYTDDEWAAAKTKADDILKEYNDGDKTEYDFALLAEKYSTDTASISAGMQKFGGVYLGIQAGTMVPEFEKWSMDDARKYGDTDIVKTNYGYHIMFFIDKSPAYVFTCKQEALADKQSKKYDNVKIEKTALFKKTKVAKPLTEEEANANANMY